MNDADKLAAYERVVEIIRDALALEKHFAEQGAEYGTIESLRLDAYRNVVGALFGTGVLHKLEYERTQVRVAKAV